MIVAAAVAVAAACGRVASSPWLVATGRAGAALAGADSAAREAMGLGRTLHGSLQGSRRRARSMHYAPPVWHPEPGRR